MKQLNAKMPSVFKILTNRSCNQVILTINLILNFISNYCY